MIVDTQVHIWGANTPERPWPPDGVGRAHRPEPVGNDDLLREMDAAGVDRVVIVPPSWEGDRNDLALQAARLHPSRFAVMGRLSCSYRQAVTLFTEELDFLSGEDTEWIMRRGVADWLGWPLPTETVSTNNRREPHGNA